MVKCKILVQNQILIHLTSVSFTVFEKLCGRIQAKTKYERYMLALIRDVVRFLGKAAVTIEN